MLLQYWRWWSLFRAFLKCSKVQHAYFHCFHRLPHTSRTRPAAFSSQLQIWAQRIYTGTRVLLTSRQLRPSYCCCTLKALQRLDASVLFDSTRHGAVLWYYQYHTRLIVVHFVIRVVSLSTFRARRVDSITINTTIIYLVGIRSHSSLCTPSWQCSMFFHTSVQYSIVQYCTVYR